MAEGYYRALATVDSSGDFSFVFLMNSGVSTLRRPPSAHIEVRQPAFPTVKALRPLWDHVVCPLQSRLHRANILHYPLNVGPLVSLNLPVVVTVHDLASFFYARAFPRALTLKRRYFMAVQRRLVARAATVVTDTVHVADLVSEILKRPRATIRVVPLGVIVDEEQTLTLESHSDAPTILCVTSGGLHKNVTALLDALAVLLHARPDVTLDLVGIIPAVSGPDTFGTDAIRRRTERLGISQAVRIRGYVPDQVLQSLYTHCTLVVVPSLYEGFGLPVLEAMARGRAVAAADIPVLREVADDAALFFDPKRPESMAEAMQRIIDDTAIRQTLGQQGRERSRLFSWERTGRGLLEVYRAVSD